MNELARFFAIWMKMPEALDTSGSRSVSHRVSHALETGTLSKRKWPKTGNLGSGGAPYPVRSQTLYPAELRARGEELLRR